MKMISGTFLGYTQETRRYNDKQTGEAKQFDSRQFHVLDGFTSERIELGRDFADSHPNPNDHVTLEVVPRVSGGNVYWTCLRVLEAKAPGAVKSA